MSHKKHEIISPFNPTKSPYPNTYIGFLIQPTDLENISFSGFPIVHKPSSKLT